MNYGCVPRNDEVFCYTSLIFVDVHDVEFCCFPTFTKLFQENQLSQQWFFLEKNYFPSLTSKTWHSRAWVAEKNYYTLTRFGFLFAHMKANTMWWRKNIYTRHLHTCLRTATRQICYCNPLFCTWWYFPPGSISEHYWTWLVTQKF